MNVKYKTIPGTNGRYGADRFGNVFDNKRNKIVAEYSSSGSVKIKYFDGWRSISQSRLKADLWGEEIADEMLSPKDAILKEIEVLENSILVLKNIIKKIE